MKKRIGTGMTFLMTGIFLLVCFGMPHNVSASERLGSLTIYYHGVTPQGEQIALAEAEFSLYKVGEKVKNGWELQGAFENAEMNLEDMTSSGQKKVAEELNDFVVKEKLKGKTKVTGDDGKVVFSHLEEGIYLCVPGKEVVCENRKFRSAPFLVFLPEIDENGNCFYDVTVEPKNEWGEIEAPHNPPQPEKKPENLDGDGVKTGDDTDIWEYLVFLSASGCIMAIMFYKKRINFR